VHLKEYSRRRLGKQSDRGIRRQETHDTCYRRCQLRWLEVRVALEEQAGAEVAAHEQLRSGEEAVIGDDHDSCRRV
jgi:hypothetical protein